MTLEQLTNYLAGYGCQRSYAKRLAYAVLSLKTMSQEEATRKAQLSGAYIDAVNDTGITWKQQRLAPTTTHLKRWAVAVVKQ